MIAVIPLILGVATFSAGIVGEGFDSWLACFAGGWLTGEGIEQIWSGHYYTGVRP